MPGKQNADDEGDRRLNRSFDAMDQAIGKMAPVWKRSAQVTFAWGDLLWRMGLRRKRPENDQHGSDA